MSKLRIFYVISLVILLGVILAFIMFQPVATSEKYSEVLREQLLQTEDGWIIQFDIINFEGKDIHYTITSSVDGQSSTISIFLLDGEMYTYTKHIDLATLTEGKASFTIYKGDEATPFEQTTYYLKR